MWNMQLFQTHLLVVSDCWYIQNSASGGAKMSFLNQQWLYFPSRLLSFKDIKYWRPQKDAPCKAAYFIYQALNLLFNIGELNCGNRLAKTGTEQAGLRFSWNCHSRHGPKMQPLLTLTTVPNSSWCGHTIEAGDCLFSCGGQPFTHIWGNWLTKPTRKWTSADGPTSLLSGNQLITPIHRQPTWGMSNPPASISLCMAAISCM